MRELQWLKQGVGATANENALPPQSITGATASNYVDTSGYDDMLVVFNFGAMVGDLSVCKLQESAASGSGYADTATATLADLTAATNQDTQSEMYVNLRGHKRYFKADITPGTSALVCVTFIMWNPNGVLPSDAPSRNVAQYVYVDSVAQ